MLLRWDKYTLVEPAYNHSGIEHDLFAGVKTDAQMPA